MAEFRYDDMDRRGKTNKSRFPYRESKERRMVYLWGYVDASLKTTAAPLISISSYMDTFRISRRTAHEDLKEIRKRYPEIIILK